MTLRKSSVGTGEGRCGPQSTAPQPWSAPHSLQPGSVPLGTHPGTGQGLVNSPLGLQSSRCRSCSPSWSPQAPGMHTRQVAWQGCTCSGTFPPPLFPQGMGCSHLGARLGRAELRQWQDEKAWALGTLWDLEGRPLHSPGLTGRGELWSAPHGGFCLHTCQSQSRGHMLPSTVCPHPPGCKK